MAKKKKKGKEVTGSKQTGKSTQKEIAHTEMVSEFMTPNTRKSIRNARKHADDIPDSKQKFGVFNRKGAPGMPKSRRVKMSEGDEFDEKAPSGSKKRKKFGRKK